MSGLAIAFIVAGVALLIAIVLLVWRPGRRLRLRVRPGPVPQPTREGLADEAARDRGGELRRPEQPESVDEASAHDRRRATGG